jgi:uncharacterized delta-60 repeat protein
MVILHLVSFNFGTLIQSPSVKKKRLIKTKMFMLKLMCNSAAALFFVISFVPSLFAQPGSLVPDYGDNGVVIAPPTQENQTDSQRSAAITPDDKMVTCGYTTTFDIYDAYLARFNTDGTQDNSFGTGGVVINSESPFTQYADVIAEPDGKLVVCGVRSETFSSQGHDCYVVRYNENGTPDSSFGNGGYFTTALSASTDGLMRILRLPEGGYVCLGRSGSGAAGIAVLLMLTESGTLDSSFGNGGVKTNLFSTVSPQGTSDIALSTDGNILALGGGDGVVKLAKFDLNGNLVSAFGDNGTVIVPTGRHLRVNTDGSILVMGELTSGTVQMVTYKFLSNGDVDTSFGSAGTSTYNSFGMDQFFNYLARPLLYPDGRYLRGWRHIITVNNEPKRKTALTWFNPDGSLAAIGEAVHDISPDPNAFSDQSPDHVVMDSNGDVFSYGTYQDEITQVQFIMKFFGDLNQVSVHESEQASGVSVYPNPASEFVFISGIACGDVREVIVYDAAGKRMESARVTSLKVDVSHLSTGHYTVMIRMADDTIHTTRFFRN